MYEFYLSLWAYDKLLNTPVASLIFKVWSSCVVYVANISEIIKKLKIFKLFVS